MNRLTDWFNREILRRASDWLYSVRGGWWVKCMKHTNAEWRRVKYLGYRGEQHKFCAIYCGGTCVMFLKRCFTTYLADIDRLSGGGVIYCHLHRV